MAEQIETETVDKDTNRATLLLVDDEQNIIASLLRTLRPDGYRILVANDGNTALALLEENTVDVIVADQRMPKMSGVEFLSRIKNAQPDTIRIVLSGYTDLNAVIEAVNAGAIYKFLTKPWDDDQLRQSIAQAVRHKRLADENRKLTDALAKANQELESANRQLRQMLERARHELEIDCAVLNLTRDVLDSIPLPIIGIDKDGLVVFANASAETSFGQTRPLLCAQYDEVLPASVHALSKDDANTEHSATIETSRYRVRISSLGVKSKGRGKILMFLPEPPHHG